MITDLNNVNILPFDYVVGSGALAGNAVGVSTLSLQADSKFELWGIHSSCTSDADTDFIPNGWKATIQDMSTGRLLSNSDVPQRVLTPAPSGGWRFPRPVIFPPSANLQFTFTELSGSTNTITLVLRGYKLFNF